MPSGDPALPAYNGQLSAFHRAFEIELRQMLADLPLTPGMRVLDLACGDGFYARRIAERLGPGGSVVAVDVDPAYLNAARAETSRFTGPATIELVEASFDRMPFPPESFDFIWCAQCLQSLPDPVLVLRYIAPLLRPGGLVAILENDTMHQVFLPWPVGLELPLRIAELRALAETGNPAKFYVGRRLPAVFVAAGLEPIQIKTLAIDRQAPLGDAEHTLLQSYLDELVERVRPHLEPVLLDQLRQLADPTSVNHALRQPFLTMTWVNVLALARRTR